MQVIESGDHQLSAQSRGTVPAVRVHGDDVDLAELGVGVLVDLRPAEPVEPALAVLVQQEAGRVEPGLGFPLLQGGAVPASLFGVPVKGPVVDLQPGVFVDADLERPGTSEPGPQAVLHGERAAHLVEDATRSQVDRSCDLVVLRPGLVDPHVDVAAAGVGDHPGGGPHQVDADGVAGCPVVGVDHELQGPVALAPRHLGVADRMLMAVLPGDQAGKSSSAALHQIHPGVLVQGRMGVCRTGGVEQVANGRDITAAQVGLYLDPVHPRQSTARHHCPDLARACQVEPGRLRWPAWPDRELQKDGPERRLRRLAPRVPRDGPGAVCT